MDKKEEKFNLCFIYHNCKRCPRYWKCEEETNNKIKPIKEKEYININLSKKYKSK